MEFNKEKILTIIILPTMWLLYFLFEVFSGRVKGIYNILLNLSLILLFAFIGYIIYKISRKKENGLNNKLVLLIFIMLMLLDQGIKLIIKLYFFNDYIEIIPKFLYFNPIINTHGSWLNVRFNLNINFSFLIFINIICLILFIEIYRYCKYKLKRSFWIDMCFLFILSGALCSFIDKAFYGGSLDFIGISDLFIADFKDIYINLSLLFLILSCYKNNFFSNENTSLKDDWKLIKNFFKFMKDDIKNIIKKEL